MARGIFTVGDSREAVEARVRAEAPEVRILRSRRISLTGLPPAAVSGPLESPWVVVVEHEDEGIEQALPQHEDPEGHVERWFRQMYLDVATEPDALVSGTIEELDCPGCGKRVEVSLPAPRSLAFEAHASCTNCGAFLVRWKDDDQWRTPTGRSDFRPECAFCGANADSLEHVIPRWMSERLGIHAEMPVEVVFGAHSPRRRKQAISFGGYRAPVMCHGCNQHFGQELEPAVIPLLVPLARNTSLALGAMSQELLARWAAKTAVALLSAEDPALVPASVGRALRVDARVPDSMWIGFFPWRGNPRLWTSAGDGPDHEGRYGAVLTFGTVGFCVLGTAETARRVRVSHEQVPVRQFSPARHRMIEWPSGPPVDETFLSGLREFVPFSSSRSRSV